MNVAERFRDELIAQHGETAGAQAEHAEAIGISEYGASLTKEMREAFLNRS